MIKKLKMEHFFNHFSPHPTGSGKHNLPLFRVAGKKVRDTVEEFKLRMICLCCLLFSAYLFVFFV
jgi:hypothetical protein